MNFPIFMIRFLKFDMIQYQSNTQKMKLLVILTTLYSISSAFEITVAKPKVAIVKEEEPRDVILSCKTDTWWNTCDFSHNGTSVCKIRWTSGENVKVDDDCNDGVEYVKGEYGQYKCSLKLSNVGFEHDGIWTCKMDNYYTRSKDEESKEYDSEKMKIEIIPLPTTTISTITTITTTTKPNNNIDDDVNPRINTGNNTATSIKLGVAFSFFLPMMFFL